MNAKLFKFKFLSPIKTDSRKKYYKENALKAYKDDVKKYKARDTSKSTYTYRIINDFLKINNVNDEGINIVNLKLAKVNREQAKDIIQIVLEIDNLMTPLKNTKIFYKGITHISKKTLDRNLPNIKHIVQH